MKIALTLRATTRSLSEATATRFRRATEDLGVSLASIADALDRSHGLVEKWAKPSAGCRLPVYALASVEAVPEPLYMRIVHEIEELRHEQSQTAPKPEGACWLLLSRLGAGVEQLARSLADGRVTALERPAVLRRVAEIEASCASVRRAFDLDRVAS